jgi:hypothetical protein
MRFPIYLMEANKAHMSLIFFFRINIFLDFGFYRLIQYILKISLTSEFI